MESSRHMPRVLRFPVVRYTLVLVFSFFFVIQNGITAQAQQPFGDFALISPRNTGGMSLYLRRNDEVGLPWMSPGIFSLGSGIANAVSLIQSNFGTPGIGNFEVVARIGDRLAHFWREDRPPFAWHGPLFFGSGVSSSPALIQSRHGIKGHFDLVVPAAGAGLRYYWRDNDKPEVPWNGPFDFASDIGRVDAVTLIQSNFGTPGIGNFEVVARIGDRLAHFWREDRPPFAWHGPLFFGSGVSGNPALIQSRHGIKGHFDLVVPAAGAGLRYYWRDNDKPEVPWNGPFDFASDIGRVDAVTLIQSNFGTPGIGNFEVVARISDRLAHFWREDTSPFAWHGPFFMTLASGVSETPTLIQTLVPGGLPTAGIPRQHSSSEVHRGRCEVHVEGGWLDGFVRVFTTVGTRWALYLGSRE